MSMGVIQANEGHRIILGGKKGTVFFVGTAKFDFLFAVSERLDGLLRDVRT